MEALAGRIVAAYRIGSSPIAVATLVLGNLIPLAGVLFWDWNLMTILVLYWIENGIVGALNVPKLLLAGGTGSGLASILGRVGLSVFFVIHYGIFWLGHGFFVTVAIPSIAGTTLVPGDAGTGVGAGTGEFGLDPEVVAFVGAAPTAVALGAVALALSHGASFVFNYLGRAEYRTADPSRQMGAPYGRVVVLHLTIIFGAFVAIALGNPLGVLLVLVVLKIAVDLGFHLHEHRRA